MVRAIGADWFRPKAMRAMKVRVDELAKRYVDQMLAAGNECDFVQEVAVNYPLYVIMSLLGLPESDFPRMHGLHPRAIRQRRCRVPARSDNRGARHGAFEMFNDFNEVTASRRANPTEDLASAIANARIDGEPLSDIETVSYYVIVATAGHDTTSASDFRWAAGAYRNPDQLQRLRANPELMPLATRR